MQISASLLTKLERQSTWQIPETFWFWLKWELICFPSIAVCEMRVLHNGKLSCNWTSECLKPANFSGQEQQNFPIAMLGEYSGLPWKSMSKGQGVTAEVLLGNCHCGTGTAAAAGTGADCREPSLHSSALSNAGMEQQPQSRARIQPQEGAEGQSSSGLWFLGRSWSSQSCPCVPPGKSLLRLGLGRRAGEGALYLHWKQEEKAGQSPSWSRAPRCILCTTRAAASELCRSPAATAASPGVPTVSPGVPAGHREAPGPAQGPVGGGWGLLQACRGAVKCGNLQPLQLTEYPKLHTLG